MITIRVFLLVLFFIGAGFICWGVCQFIWQWITNKAIDDLSED